MRETPPVLINDYSVQTRASLPPDPQTAAKLRAIEARADLTPERRTHDGRR